MAEPSADAGYEELLNGLADGLTRLGRLVAAYSEDTWRRSADNGWSAHQVLAHLRASNEILAPRVIQMLVRDGAPLPAFDERVWAAVAGYRDMSAEALFARIAMPRYELIQLLRRCPPDAWSRGGLHEEHGRVTVADVVAHLVGHEEEHLDQIEALLRHPPAQPAPPGPESHGSRPEAG